MKTFVLVLIFSIGLYASEGEIFLLKKKIPSQPKKETQKNKTNEYEKLKANNEILKKLLLRRTSGPTIWDGEQRILTGKVFRGRLLNSIVSTNMESPVLVEAYPDQGLPYGSRFSCVGSTKFKRVHVICNKLVTNFKELSVSVQILNPDGTAGLLGTFDDGKDELITGVLVSNLTQGALASAQARIGTNALSNQLTEGAFNSAKGASEILTDEMKTKEPIVMIDSGKDILIFFMEAVDV